MKSRSKLSEILNDEKGQGVFEVMVFLPIMLYLLSILLNVGNSINASINQQKASRGYLFYLLKGNSQGTRKSDLDYFSSNGGGINLVSPFIVGWRLESGDGGKESFGAYYQLPSVPLGGKNTPKDDCMDKFDGSESSTCIKIFTLYGVCGDTYALEGDGRFFHTNNPTSTNPLNKDCKMK